MNKEIDMQFEAFSTLDRFIASLREEMSEDTTSGTVGMRWMREGVGIFLDEFMPDFSRFWLSPTLRFNPEKISIERVERGRVIPSESTPGGIELWKNKSEVIVSTIGAHLRQQLL